MVEITQIQDSIMEMEKAKGGLIQSRQNFMNFDSLKVFDAFSTFLVGIIKIDKHKG